MKIYLSLMWFLMIEKRVGPLLGRGYTRRRPSKGEGIDNGHRSVKDVLGNARAQTRRSRLYSEPADRHPSKWTSNCWGDMGRSSAAAISGIEPTKRLICVPHGPFI